jgi:hypothetical protein
MEETKVVVSADPANSTCAPLTKLLPFTVNEKLPEATDVGEMLLSTGTGFSTITVAEAAAPELAALTAWTVTTFETGATAGAM